MKQQLSERPQTTVIVPGLSKPSLIPTEFYETLHPILKAELCQDIIRVAPYEVKKKLTEDIMRLLQVRSRNEGLATGFIYWLTRAPYQITAGEIYIAYEMAMNRQLFDQFGNEFDLIADLSINTTSKIISAFQKSKKLNRDYWKSRNELKSLTDGLGNFIDKEKIEREFLEKIYNDLQVLEVHSDGWLLYDKLLESGKIKPFSESSYNAALAAYKDRLERLKNATRHPHDRQRYADVVKMIEEKKILGSVENDCKSLSVSRYLRKHVATWDGFYTAVTGKNL